jgi:23S rRNA C2498 (ribose-2'-O)-methylase RlmM
MTTSKRQKTGGRKKGTPNKTQTTLRQTVTLLLEKQFALLPKLLDQLEPRDRIELTIKLMPYALPRLRDQEPEPVENPATSRSQSLLELTRKHFADMRGAVRFRRLDENGFTDMEFDPERDGTIENAKVISGPDELPTT